LEKSSTYTIPSTGELSFTILLSELAKTYDIGGFAFIHAWWDMDLFLNYAIIIKKFY